MRKPNQKELQKQVDDFNSRVKIGDEVDYYSCLGDPNPKMRTKTTTKASILEGHTSVVWIEGISGCVNVAHVHPVNPRKGEK